MTLDDGGDSGHLYASIFGGSAGIFLSVSFLFHVIAYASPFWFYSESYHLGLWVACYELPPELEQESSNATEETDRDDNAKWECVSASTWINSVAPGFENDWLTGIQAIMTISLIFLISSCVGLVYFAGSSDLKKHISQAIVFGSFCFTFATACFTLTTVIVCGVQVDQEDSAVYRSQLSWSYYLSLTTTVVVWLCTGALTAELIRAMSGPGVTPSVESGSAQDRFATDYHQLQQTGSSRFDIFQTSTLQRESEAAAIENEAYCADCDSSVENLQS